MSESRFELPGFIKKPLKVAASLAEQGKKILGIPERMIKKHGATALSILFTGAVLGVGGFWSIEGWNLFEEQEYEGDGFTDIAQIGAGGVFSAYALGLMLHAWGSSYTAKLKAQKAK